MEVSITMTNSETFFHFSGFQGFDQRHIPVKGKTVGIKIIIKAVRIYSQFFPKYCKLPQKFPIIISFPVLYFQLVQKISVLLYLTLWKKFQGLFRSHR